MNMYLSHMIGQLEKDTRKSRYRLVIKKIQKFLEQQGNQIQRYSISLLIKFFHIEVYSCRKVFLKQIIILSISNELGQKQKKQSRKLSDKLRDQRNQDRKTQEILSIKQISNLLKLLQIMLRNFKYVYKLIDRTYNRRMLMMKLAKNCKNTQNFNFYKQSVDDISDFISKKDMNRFFEIVQWIVHEWILLHTYIIAQKDGSKQINKYIKVKWQIQVQKRIQFIEIYKKFYKSLNEYGYGKHTKQSNLSQIQINKMYANSLIILNRNIDSKQQVDKNIVSLLSILGNLNNNNTRGGLRNRKISKIKKKCGQKLFISCLLLIQIHINRSQIQISKQIYEIVQQIIKLGGVRQFHDRFSIFPSIMKLCQKMSTEYQDLKSIVQHCNIFRSTQIDHYRKLSKQKNQIYDGNKCFFVQTNHLQKYMDQNEVKQNQINKNYLCQANFQNIRVQQKSKIKTNTWCPKPNKVILPKSVALHKKSMPTQQQSQSSSKRILNQNTIKIPIQKLREQRDSINIQNKFNENTTRISKYTSSIKLRKKALPTDSQIYKLTENLKNKKQILIRNHKFDSSLQPQYFTHTQNIVQNIKGQTSVNKTQNKKFQQVGIYFENKGDQNIFSCFLRIILKNKKKFNISEYSCRIQNYLSRLELRKDGLMEKYHKKKQSIIKQNISNKTLSRKKLFCHQLGSTYEINCYKPIGNQDNKQRSKYKSDNTQKSQKSIKMSQISIKNIDDCQPVLSSSFSINCIKNNVKSMKNDDLQQKNTNKEHQLNLCHRKSMESIENVMKRINLPVSQQKIIRKNYKLLPKKQRQSRYSLF